MYKKSAADVGSLTDQVCLLIVKLQYADLSDPSSVVESTLKVDPRATAPDASSAPATSTPAAAARRA